MKSAFWSVVFVVLTALFVASGCGPKQSEPTPDEAAPDETSGSGTEAPDEAEKAEAALPPRAIFARETLYAPRECLKELNNGGSTPEYQKCVWESDQNDVYESGGAIPLVCYDPQAAAWIDFSSAEPPVQCMRGVPQVVTLDGQGVQLTGKLVPAECQADGGIMPAVSAEWGGESDYAFIQTESGSLEQPVEGDAISDKQKAEIEKLLQEVVNDVDGATLPEMQILQVVRLELDGDDSPDLLISASAPDPDDITYKPGGLFMISGAEPEVVQPLHMSSLEEYEVLGVSDLDGNQRQEFLLGASYYEGYYIYVEHIVGSEPVVLGGAGCGA